MREVNISPMPQAMRAYSMKFQPRPAPIFGGYTTPPTDEEIALARELFTALDEQSQDWYRRGSRELFAGL